MRNRKIHEYRVTCAYCGRVFMAKSAAARTCSPKCRTALFRDVHSGNGKTWHSVRPEYGQKASEIRTISESAYNAICGVLQNFGAIAAEYAIAAAWDVATECLSAIEEKRL